MPTFATGQSSDESESDENETFYTEGSEELRLCRLKILKYSIAKSSARLNSRFVIDQETIANNVGPFKVTESQYADDRCVSRGCLSPDELLFATSGWSSDCKVWGVPDC